MLQFLLPKPKLYITPHVIRIAMVRQVGSNWVVLSESGKRLGTYKSKKAAEERLRQIEYFKHVKGKK